MSIDFRTVKQLIIKDWQLHRNMIAGYVATGILGLALLGYPHLWTFYMGCIILLTVMIAAGFHAITATIIAEKKDQTTPFILSLPVQPAEYALAKAVANMGIFFTAWLFIVISMVFLVMTTHIPNGLLPFFLAICLFLVMSYCIVLSVALMTESEGWSIFTMVLLNLLLNPVIMLAANNPLYYSHFKTDTIVWHSLFITSITLMLVAALAVITFALIRQTRRRTFI